MPYGDGTGPMGAGPQTGRGAGFCAGFRVPGFMNRPWFGRGFLGNSGWIGRGGRGWRHWFRATGLPGWMRAGQMNAAPVAAPVAQSELANLEQECRQVEEYLKQLHNRMEALKSSAKDTGNAAG